MSQRNNLQIRFQLCRKLGYVFIPCIAFLSAMFTPVFSSTSGAYTGQNPSPHQIDSAWRALYGTPTHDAILVYNKMTGGSSDATEDSLCIMRFGLANRDSAMKKTLMHFQQWIGASGWGVSSTYRISPDGSKIAMQNGTGVYVCDTNGTNLQLIESITAIIDQLNMSWDDSAGIRRLVYASNNGNTPFVLRRVINSTTNAKGTCDTLWSHAWGKDPSVDASWDQRYTSVNKVGHYLCFDMSCNANIPIVVDIVAKTAQNPTDQGNSLGGDGCQVRMLEDGLGTVSYHPNTHLTSANVWRWGMNKDATLFKIPCPNGSSANCTDCGNNMFYWCDSDTSYLAQCGDNDQQHSAGCYTKAFIRKGKTSAHMMYVGDYVAFPALWINPTAPGTKATITSSAFILSRRATITLTRTELILANYGNRTIDNAILLNLTGAILASGRKAAPDQQKFTLLSVPSGTYILSWRSGNETSARFVTIAK